MTIAGMRASVERLWRYYQAGIVNTLFGYSLFAILVKLGLNMYVAQLIAHVLGVTFNYFTYSMAFRGARASKSRFILSYVANYFIGLATLATCASFIKSPYLAMAVTLVIVTTINYFMLRRLVFTSRAEVQS
ncbi:MAG: GtrA family protein [Sphingomicrobium sp.]|nr:GtrA family protein [Sphingomonadales bacterium]